MLQINELEYSPSFGRQPPTSHHRASLEPTTRAPITRKRDFNLDEFTLDDLMNLNGQPVGLEALAIAAATEPTAEPPTTTTTTTELPPGDGRDLHAQPRSANACGKTRVAAGASGYLRLSCVEGTSSSTTTKPNPITPASLVELRASLLHQLDNAQFRRMNSNFEMLVDALRSGAIQPLK